MSDFDDFWEHGHQDDFDSDGPDQERHQNDQLQWLPHDHDGDSLDSSSFNSAFDHASDGSLGQTARAIESLKEELRGAAMPENLELEFQKEELRETAAAIQDMMDDLGTQGEQGEIGGGAEDVIGTGSSGDYDIMPDGFDALAGTHQMHGTPELDIVLWDGQDDPMSCAAATTNMIFRSMGLDIGENLIADIFQANGIYDPASGANPDLIDDTINAIAHHGNLPLSSNQIDGFTEDTLRELLDNQIRPLVAVDSNELYSEEGLFDFFDPVYSGHAVQVTGYDGEYVYVNDPGFAGGAGQQIPVDKFMRAADDFGFKAITVQYA